MPLDFYVVDVNPNDSTGGGGSLAGPMHDKDATGPWVVWPNQEYESYISPHAVVAASEVRLMAKALDNLEAGRTEALAGGERESYVEPPTQDTGAGTGPESEVYDLADPDSFDKAAAFARGE